MKLLIKNGRVIDPRQRLDGPLDLLTENGKIQKVGQRIKNEKAQVIDAKGLLVMPGFIDMHTHLREPGREDEETILTGSRAAIKGGFTSVCAMPNTTPCCDNEGVANFILQQARKADLANIFPVGAITKGREGKELSEIWELGTSGCVGISDDGKPVASSSVMRRAMEYAAMIGLTIISHSEDKNLSRDGVMNEGIISTILGLGGIPREAEAMAVARDIALARLTRAKLHIAHVSTKDSIETIKQAKKEGLKVTCETAPHYFSLTHEACREFDSNTKMNPPLRTEEDVKAIKDALRDGTIDAVATDHAPHTPEEKDREFDQAPFGIVGLESAFGLCVKELIESKILSWSQLVEKLSANPAAILGLNNKGTLAVGSDADIVIVDPGKKWALEESGMESKSKNSPFLGWKFMGQVKWVVVGGKVKLEDGRIA